MNRPGNDESRSVVICCYTDDRWDRLSDAVTGAAEQLDDADELIVVVDHNDGLLRRVQTEFGELAVVVPSEGEPGLSGARNTGVAHGRNPVVVFLDDDATPDAEWLTELTAPFEDAAVVGVGGHAEPMWHSGSAPWWMPDEYLWVVGCSHLGLPTDTAPIRNPIGASMAIRRTVLDGLGGFRTGVGRVDTVPLGCEETELAIRARQRGFDVVFEPRAVVDHEVTGTRGTFGYFVRRCYAEGLSKAKITDVVSVGEALEAERRYVVRTLPRGVARGVVRFVTGPAGGTHFDRRRRS